MSAGQHTSKGAITPRLAEIAEISYPARFAHLTAVWAFSVSQPIFSLLGANPEFMVVRRATTLEVVVFAVALTFAAPIAGAAIEWLVAIVSRTAAAALHAGLVGVFFLPFALQMVKEVDVGVVFTFACATAMAALVVANYLVWRPVRLFLSVLFALPVVGLVGFVTSVPLAQESAASINVSVSSETPVVVLVMDEFPVSSLMTANGTIDAARYPNFARLGRSAIWYPRATSVHEHTTGAVPAMLTGSIPEPGDLPTLTDHPDNLFTLLGDSHAYNAEETDTVLCPQRYCAQRRDPLLERLASLFSDAQVAYLHRVLPKSMAGGLPPIGDRWGGFRDRDGLLIARDSFDVDRVIERLKLTPTRTRFAAFVSKLGATSTDPSFHFHHLPLPHSAWRFFPSGREYGNSATIDGILDSWNTWANDPWLVQQGYQRHLLQTGFVDRLLGQFLNKLERTGLYDRALVVVAADHGVSFEADGTRRTVSAENIADIARVPLFVKLPGQRGGRIDRRAVQTIDVLPTIADVLDVELPWRTDGRSLLEARDGSRVVVMSRRDGTRITVPTNVVDADMSLTLRRKARLFGEGRDSLFHIGVNTALLGSSVQAHVTESADLARIRFDGEELFEDVRPNGPFVPARITGTISGRDIAPNQELAMAVNDRVVALTHSWRINGQQRFSALVPEHAFREGRNQVGLYLIAGRGSGARLLPLGRTSPGEQVELDLGSRIVRVPGEKSLRIVDDHIAGQAATWKLDAQTVRVRGWAADLRNNALIDRVLMFSAGTLVYSATATEFRWDVPETQGERGLERTGWVIAVPVRVLAAGDVHILAERAGVASELPLPSDFPWAPGK